MRASLMFRPLRGTESQDSVHRPQLFEESGEPKRNRTDVPLLTMQTIKYNAFSFGRCEDRSNTPSIAFRHLPPDSARIGYATEGALFIST